MTILAPVLALALWSVVMASWMFAVRVPFVMRSGTVSPQDTKHTADFAQRTPSEIRQVGDNYNNLFELPVVFYAVSLAIAIAGHADPLHIKLAWAYVALRVVHSIVQATYNNVTHRFAVFSLSCLVLTAMIIREALRML